MAKDHEISAPAAGAPAAGPWPGGGPVHGDLLAAKTLVYDPSGFACSPPQPEAESAEYGAYAFTLDGLSVRFRAAKITPTKIGQFVTVWQRSASGPIRPFDSADPVDLFVISTRDGGHFGQFVFSRDALRERGIVSRDGAGGKRAFRVYPPWVTTVNRQARTTQRWQLEHFLGISGTGGTDGAFDATRARALYRP
ncbi:MepB family protein [Streptomyces sp. NPDC101227]|uniref:MepB family protein n=1 Tax=Streptomyces sp. NPDC101227 TaxID=3366136 RepID=UPI00381565B5